MEKIAVVMNPSSGRGLAAALEPWLRLRLRDRVEILMVSPGVDAAKWAREKADAGASRILVIGGDGTFRSVGAALIGTETPIGLVSCGTNNNIAAHCGLPHPLKLAGDRSVEMTLEIDPPSERQTVKAFTMTISNTPVTGAHLNLAPGIDIRDPKLYLTVYHDLGRLKLMASAHALSQGHKGHGYTSTRYPFMRLKIQSEYPCHVHADGTLIGTLPIDVVSIPKAIRVALPPPGTVLTPHPDEVVPQPALIEKS